MKFVAKAIYNGVIENSFKNTSGQVIPYRKVVLLDIFGSPDSLTCGVDTDCNLKDLKRFSEYDFNIELVDGKKPKIIEVLQTFETEKTKNK